MAAEGRHLVLYDGVCGLCNRLNQFILRRDRQHVFDFAPLQSATARKLLDQPPAIPEYLDTFYVIANYRQDTRTLLMKSRAAIFVMRTLGWPWQLAQTLAVVPSSILDKVYDLIARHRYRLFGRYESCPLPRPEYRERFIDI
jgi:predicted DCC family thiol-disulfide oxidoreductase YuxK